MSETPQVPFLKIDIPDDLFDKIEASKPEYLDRKGFVCLILDQALDTSGKVVACSAGAGNRNGVSQTLPLQFPPELGVTNSEAPAEAVKSVQSKSWKPQSVNARLQKFESLILAFWKVKKGSRGEIAWKRLQGQLEKLLDAYGESVVEDQLELAINGKWTGIDLVRYEQYKPTGKNAPKRVERKLSPEEEAAKKEADHQAWLKSLNLN